MLGGSEPTIFVSKRMHVAANGITFLLRAAERKVLQKSKSVFTLTGDDSGFLC